MLTYLIPTWAKSVHTQTHQELTEKAVGTDEAHSTKT